MEPHHPQQHSGAPQTATHSLHCLQNTAIPYPPPPQIDHLLLQAIDSLLTIQQQNLMTRMDHFQASLNRLVGIVSTARQESHTRFTGLDDLLKDSHRKHIAGLQILLKKVNEVEKLPGPSPSDSVEPSTSIIGRVSSIEKDIRDIVQRMNDPKSDRSVSNSILRHEVGTSPHLSSVDLPEKSYCDVEVGAATPPPSPILVPRSTNKHSEPEKTYRNVITESQPLPIYISRSTSTQRELDKEYHIINVWPRPSPTLTSGVATTRGADQPYIDNARLSMALPPFLPPSSSAGNNDGSYHLWNPILPPLPCAHDMIFGSQFGPSDVTAGSLVSATWARPQDGSSTGTFSTEPSIHDGLPRDGKRRLMNTMIFLRTRFTVLLMSSEQVFFMDTYRFRLHNLFILPGDAQNSLPSPPMTQAPSSTSPEVNKASLLPNNNIQDYHKFGAAIDTSLIFAPVRTGNENLKPVLTPKVSGLQPDFGSMSPLTPVSGDDEDRVEAFQKSIGVNPLKRKKFLFNHTFASDPPAKKGRIRKTATPRRKSKATVVKSRPVVHLNKSGVDTVWPEITSGDVCFQKQFIQCDTCLSWYHYVCVGILENDPRVESDATFECQRCEQTSDKETRINAGNQEEVCARPNCGQLDQNEFFVEKLLGRRLKAGGEFEWLVKYDGYPVKDSTWEVVANIGAHEHHIAAFMETARREGLDIDQGVGDMVLLARAADLAFMWK